MLLAALALPVAHASAEVQVGQPKYLPLTCATVSAHEFNEKLKIRRNLGGPAPRKWASKPVCVRPDYRRVQSQIKRWRIFYASFTPQVASWYGPGFIGNTTACGQTFSNTIVGAAHKAPMPCGTVVYFRKGHRGSIVRATVIDRGPFVAGRTWDLSPALKHKLGCGDLCNVETTLRRKP